MPNSWKTRHDIDQIKWVADELERLFLANGVSNFKELLSKYYDQSEIDEVSSKLNKDLGILDNSLDSLHSALIDFNAELINFDEDNENLDEDLSKLKDNLLSFLNVLGLLDIDLSDLQSSLNDLDAQINGTANTDGLADVLTALQYSIYGEPPYDSSNPSPTSLMGMLDTFGQQLGDLSEGDNTLSLSLSTLSGYLATFKGSLADLQTQIVSDYGQTIYDSLDEDLVKLVASITQANDDLDSHQDLIDGIEDTIGSSTDTGNTTLYGVLNTTSSVASSASTKANSVESTINNTISPSLTQVKDVTIPSIKTKIGYDSIGNTSLQSQITTTDGKVDTINDTTIPAINNKIGTVNVAVDGDLQSQISNTNGVIEDLDIAIGDTSNINGSLVSNINVVISDISDVQDDIGDIQGDMYAGSSGTGTTANPASGTLMDNIATAQSNITTVQEDISDLGEAIGTVDVDNDGDLQTQIGGHSTEISSLQDDVGNVDIDVNSDLQTQILNIVELMRDLLVMVGKVHSIGEVSSDTHSVTVNGITTTYYEVAEDYPYEFIQIANTNEYYQKVDMEINNEVIQIWEWCLNPFIEKFQQTTLYDILTYFFTERATPVGVPVSYEPLSTDYNNTNFTSLDNVSIYFYKQFNIVTVYYFINTVTFSNTVDHTIIQTGRIPSDFRPSTAFKQSIASFQGTPLNAILTVDTDGSFKVAMGKANTQFFMRGSFKYIVED